MKRIEPKTINLGKINIPDQEVGTAILNVMPFIHDGTYIKLPLEYKKWEPLLNEMMSKVPVQKDAKTHYITIDSEFFTESREAQRRPGIHIDGNFCVDPNFKSPKGQVEKCWSDIEPVQPSWSGIEPKDDQVYKSKPDNSHVKMDWVLPFNIVIPVAKYVSSDKGGILIASSNVGTTYWDEHIDGHVGPAGDCSHLTDKLKKSNSKHIPANELFFMSSNTPHDSIKVEKGIRRTFLRITLNHDYNNQAIIDAA